MSRLVQPLNALVITLITCMQLATVDVSCRVLGHSDKNIDTSVIVMLCEEAGRRYLDVVCWILRATNPGGSGASSAMVKRAKIMQAILVYGDLPCKRTFHVFPSAKDGASCVCSKAVFDSVEYKKWWDDKAKAWSRI